jgi:hypothetical protein
VITSASARKQCTNRQSSFGPTCRLVSSPEVGPGATVGTLKQGTPYYSMKARSHAAISSRVANSARPHHAYGSGAATWPEKPISSKISAVGPDPHGKVSKPYTYGPDLWVRSKNLHGRARTPGTGLGPPCAGSGPLTARSRDTGTKNT